MQYIIADIGATTTKAVIMDKNGNIIEESRLSSLRGQQMLDLVLGQLDNLKDGRSITAAVIACPGIIEGGKVLYSPNLNWQDVNLAKLVSDRLDIPVTLLNDANAAALGEYHFGAGKASPDMLMLTLGTGVGGAYIRDGIILNEKGGEFGHTIISVGGEPCTCGMQGCLQQYASGTALIRESKKAMESRKDSIMWDFPSIDGSTAFLAEGLGDAAAKQVVDSYVNYLSHGLASLNNIFRPNLIVLGGGVSGEGENLLSRLKVKLASINYGFKNLPPPKIVTARLGGNAGLFGAYSTIVKNIK